MIDFFTLGSPYSSQCDEMGLFNFFILKPSVMKNVIINFFALPLLLPLLAFSFLETNGDTPPQKDPPAEQYYVYLSFDDGPLEGSQKIHDAILYEKVPISVMLVGSAAQHRHDYLELYRQNPYIEMGNHSFSHANLHYQKFYSDPEGVLNDFEKNMELLKLEDKISRFPGRNMWRINGRSKNDVDSGVDAADLLAANGFQLYGWDLEWHHDPKTGDPIQPVEELFNEIESHLQHKRTFTPNHLVLLCHDEMFRKPYEETELKQLIELLKSKGNYTFSYLRDYP